MTEQEEEKQIEDAVIVYEAVTGKTLITKSSELYRFMNALTGEVVPFHRVCEHHMSPWDMIWESFKVDLPAYNKGQITDIIAVGPREGFKTLSTAKLNALELLLKPKVDIASIGAVIKQATRCYKYTSKYLYHPIIAELQKVLNNTMAETVLDNGSRYEQLVATLTGVNSPHPQKLRADEVELMKPEVVEEMKNVPSSYNGWRAHTLYTSTRKFVEGVMSQMVEAAKKKGNSTKTIVWCYKEVSEPCPDERSGVNKKIYEVDDLLHDGEKIVVEAYEYCGDCQLLPSCRGDLKRSKGIIPIDDTIKKWLDLDPETWIAQKESQEPRRTGLFFHEWDEKFNVGDFKYTSQYPLDLFIDFTGGGADPTVMQFWQTWNDFNDYLVMELVFHNKGTDLIAREAEQICKERNIPKPLVQMGDSSQMQMIRDLRSASSFFSNLRPVKKIERKEGLSICRRRLKDNSGKRHTFVDGQCLNFRKEIKVLKRKPSDPNEHKDGDDHSIDAWRYRCVYRYHSAGEPRIRCLSEIPDNGVVMEEGSSLPEPQKISPKGPSVYSEIDRYLAESD